MSKHSWKLELADMRRWLACGWRWRVSAFLCLALLARALVPQGYMPATNEGQGALFAMVVCTPNGPLEFNERIPGIFSEASHSDNGQAQPEHAKAMCSFSAMAWQVLLAGLWQALWLIVVLQAIRAVLPRYRAPVWVPSTDIRAPRAPPFSV